MQFPMSAILEAILRAIDDLNRQLPAANRIERSAEARLTGVGGHLDSLGLVNLIVAVEQSIESTLGRTVSLTGDETLGASERVFSSVGSLADHVGELLKEKRVG